MFRLLVNPTSESQSQSSWTNMPIFDEFTFWHWLIAGVLLIVLEIFAPGVVFMWVGIAAILTGIVAWLAPDLSVQWQMLVFAGLAVSSVVGGRQWMKRNPTETDHPTLSNRGAKYIDRTFVLAEPIVDGFGKIKVDDTTWKVSGEDMEKGASVVVTGVEGTVLKVQKRA